WRSCATRRGRSRASTPPPGSRTSWRGRPVTPEAGPPPVPLHARGAGDVSHPSHQALDLGAPRLIHVVGIGGAGMSAIAEVLGRTGHRASGSDLKASSTLTRLELLGVTTGVGHDGANLPAGTDAVVVSTAIPATNPEVVAARERGVPVLRRAQALRALVATRR